MAEPKRTATLTPFRYLDRPDGSRWTLVGNDYPGEGLVAEVNICRRNAREIAEWLLRAVNSYSSQRELVGELREALSDLVEDIEQWGLMDGDPWPALDRATRLLAQCEAGDTRESYHISALGARADADLRPDLDGYVHLTADAVLGGRWEASLDEETDPRDRQWAEDVAEQNRAATEASRG